MMSIILCLNVPLFSMLETDPHLFSGPAQTMQEFMWQVDMRSVVLCIRDCLSVLLDVPVAGAADDDSDDSSTQL